MILLAGCFGEFKQHDLIGCFGEFKQHDLIDSFGELQQHGCLGEFQQHDLIGCFHNYITLLGFLITNHLTSHLYIATWHISKLLKPSK